MEGDSVVQNDINGTKGYASSDQQKIYHNRLLIEILQLSFFLATQLLSNVTALQIVHELEERRCML